MSQPSSTSIVNRNFATQPLSGDVYGALINLSGRRRFTSQRLVLYAVLASLGHDHAVASSREALVLFRDAHAALIDGKGELPGVFCKELEDAYFGPSQGDRRICEFIQLAENTLDAIESESRQARALLDELVRSATPLLAALNRITQVYEDLAKRNAQQVKKQLHGIMGDIKSIAKQARMVAFNAQIVAARAGQAGREFAVVAGVLTDITGEIDELVHSALTSSAA